MAGTSFDTKLSELLPKIKERREEIEEGRRLPKDLVAEMAATGLWKLGFPTDLGGDGASIPDVMRVLERIAAVDGSAGWIAMICGGGVDVVSKLTEEGIKEVFADPSQPIAAAIPPKGMAVPVDGGFKFSGTWPFASGITHVDWVAAGCVILYDGQPRMTPMGIPELVWGIIPVTEIEILDTWYVNGLKGTGSNDFVGKDVFVPAHRTFHMFDETNWSRPQDPATRADVSGFASMVASVGLGIARGAIDELVELAGGKMPTMSMTSLAAKPSTQIELARLEAKLGSARAFLYDSMQDLWDTLLTGEKFTPRQNALVRLAASEAARISASVAHRVSTIAGGTSLYLKSPIQRMQRDADAVTHHFVLSPPVLEDVGRVLFGMEPTSPVF